MNHYRSLPNARRTAVVLAIAVGLMLVPVGVSAAPASASTTGPDTAAPGETVTISVTISNTGDEPGGYVGDISLPEDWTIDSQSPDGAIWNAGDRSWLWQSIQPGDSVNPSMTVAIPTNETSDSYTVETAVKSNDGIEANATHTIDIQGDPVEQSNADTGSTTDTTEDGTGLFGGVPVVGIGIGVAGLGIVGYIVSRRVL